MKGLILKDLYMIKKYCKSMLFITVIFLTAGLFNTNSPFFLIYPAIFAGMIPVTLISYDEKFRWNSYCRILPYSAKQIVFSKYLLIMLLAAVLLVVYGLLAAVLSVTEYTMNISIPAILPVIFILSVSGPSLILPFIFRYGVEKGRIVFYIVIILLCALSAGIAAVKDTISFDLSTVMTNIILVAAAVVMFILSYGISLKCFKSRDL